MPPAQRRRRQDDDDADESDQPRHRQNRDGAEDEDSEGETQATGQQSADNELAKKLVRYALACEYQRQTIRREGIKERVLGTQGRSFRRILDLAQKQLRLIWGMELRELPVREKVTMQEKRAAMKSNSQPKLGSGTYILCSTLPEAYRHPSIIPSSQTPTVDDEATYAGFYTTVVTLIYLNGGELSDQKLMRYLKRLNADQNVSAEKTEATLKKMDRQGYVDKRTEKPPAGQDGEHLTTWHVGSRAKEEIGAKGVMGMVREVYGEWDDSLDKKLKASLGQRDRPGPAAENVDDVDDNGGEGTSRTRAADTD